jgi:integrase
MATFKICVFPHQRRADEKYPVSIRVYWKRKYGYVGTEYYVTIHQITQNRRKGTFELKDSFIIAELTRRIEMYEKEKLRFGLRIHVYSAQELARHFENLTERKGVDNTIDFIEFGRNYIKKETGAGRNVSRTGTTLNALQDFAGEKLPVQEMTSRFLKNFENFLRTERTVIRRNQFNKEVSAKKPPLSNASIAGYMTDLRTLFNLITDEYNDDEKGIVNIYHYPFKKYRLPDIPLPEKRNLSAETILQIIRTSDEELGFSRAELARDVFALSFLLVGINLIDLYNLEAGEYRNGRITYNRTKTENRRRDSALISIKVEPEALALIEKYRDHTKQRLFRFHLQYSEHKTFVSNINKGLKKVANVCGLNISLSSYYARHSWATIARNGCKISKSDIDECLNHVNLATKMADVYIGKDWKVIDESNRKVIDYVFFGQSFRDIFVKHYASK